MTSSEGRPVRIYTYLLLVTITTIIISPSLGEKGIIKQLVATLNGALCEDETVQLHVCTAITNLAHNSLENRSRFFEASGATHLVASMATFGDSAKYQRQASWSEPLTHSLFSGWMRPVTSALCSAGPC